MSSNYEQSVTSELTDAQPIMNNGKKIAREGFTPIPDVKWEDVGGLLEIKNEIDLRLIQRFKRPDLFEAFGVDQTGILLHGPPGCGKTMLVQALVNKVGDFVNYIHVQGPEVLKATDADSVNALTDIFTRARMHPPCILFFDNIDVYTRATLGENRIVSLLKCELNGDENKDKVYVLGATNRIDLVDPRLMTYSSFGSKIMVPLPNADERRLILESLANKKCVDNCTNFSDIAKNKACENFTGADLNLLMNEAAIAAIQDKSSIITVAHFDEAILKIYTSTTKKSESAGYIEGHEGI